MAGSGIGSGIGSAEGWEPCPPGELEGLVLRLRDKRQAAAWVQGLAAILAVGALALSLYATSVSLYNQFWGTPRPSLTPIVGPIKSAYITPKPIPPVNELR